MQFHVALYCISLVVFHLGLSAQAFRTPVAGLNTCHSSALWTSSDKLVFSESLGQPDSAPDSLTWEELASRFQDALAYFTSVPRDHPDVARFSETYTPQLALLRGRLSDLHLNRCQILQSTKPSAGRGLFATRDIKQGELITLFPADAILFRQGEMEEVSGVLYGKVRDSRSSSLTDDAARSYEVRISATHSIVGDPALIDDTAYLAHIANDAACLVKGDDESRTMYARETSIGANGVFRDIYEGCHLGLFALRPIQTGEEIFVSYGEGYWLSRGSTDVYAEAQRRDEERRRDSSRTKAKLSKINKKSNTKKKGSAKGFDKNRLS